MSALGPPLLQLFIVGMALHCVWLARRARRDAVRQRRRAHAWRRTFAAYLTADLKRDDVAKTNLAKAAAADADTMDAEELAEERRGWWAR